MQSDILNNFVSSLSQTHSVNQISASNKVFLAIVLLFYMLILELSFCIHTDASFIALWFLAEFRNEMEF